MKVGEMREATRSELTQRVMDLEEERFNLNMRQSFKKLDNPLRLRQIRREIAKVKTLLREDQIGVRSLAQQKVSILDDAKSGKEKK